MNVFKRKESDVSKDIRALLKNLGCSVYTTEQGYRRARGGTRTTAGIPDLMVFHPDGAFIFAELKTEKGKVTDAQKAFGEMCNKCRVHWAVWRSPKDAVKWFTKVKSFMRPGGPAAKMKLKVQEIIDREETPAPIMIGHGEA